MNLGQLRDAVYDYMGESSTENHIASSEINRYLNEGQSQLFCAIAELFEGFFRTSTTLSEVADTAEIALPNNCYRVSRLDRLKNNGGGALNLPYTMNRLADSRYSYDQSRGVFGQIYGLREHETGYIQHGQTQIELVPAPKSSTTDSLKLYYVYRPAEMTDDKHVPFQATAGPGSGTLHDLQEYHDLIWKWALMYALGKEQATTQFQLIDRQYQQRMDELKKYLDRMNEQEPRFVNMSEEDDWDGF